MSWVRKCPGQDHQFWTPDDVREVRCVRCGYLVEFFKTDASLRCAQCGHRLSHPDLNVSCALWCDHASACLGFDPSSIPLPSSSRDTLLNRLIEMMKHMLDPADPKLQHSLLALEHGREILAETDAAPRRTLASLLVHTIPSQAPRLLEQAGFPPAEVRAIHTASVALHEGKMDEYGELKLASKADRRAHDQQDQASTSNRQLGTKE